MKSNTTTSLWTSIFVTLVILLFPSISQGQIIFHQLQNQIFTNALQLDINFILDSPPVATETQVSTSASGPAPSVHFYTLNTEGVQTTAKFDGAKLTIFSDEVPYNYRRSPKYDSLDGMFFGFSNQAGTRAIRFPVDGGGRMRVSRPDNSWMESKTSVIKDVPITDLSFGTFSNTVELALRLKSDTNDLLLDMHFNYSHNPQFAETYRATYQLLKAAQTVHEAGLTNRRAEIKQSLEDLDGLAYRLQTDIRNWNCRSKYRCGIGSLNQKLSTVQWSVADLMHDAGVEPKELAFLSGRDSKTPPISIAPRPR